jgi:hypothetical protein
MSVGLAAALLFIVSVACGEMLYLHGIQKAQTFLDDAIIGVAGGFIVWALLFLQGRRQEWESARERMRLTAEVNLHVRNALAIMSNAVLVQDQADRLRLMDEAIQRIDHVLNDLVPAAGTAHQPRLFN